MTISFDILGLNKDALGDLIKFQEKDKPKENSNLVEGLLNNDYDPDDDECNNKYFTKIKYMQNKNLWPYYSEH